MEDTKARIEEVRKHLKELRVLQREEIRAARAALPKKKPGRKPISPAILSRAIKLAETMPLTDVALRCDVALMTLYNHGISRKSLNEMKAKATAKPAIFDDSNNSIIKLTADDEADILAARESKKEYLQTGISYTVDELKAEFGLISNWLVAIEKARQLDTGYENELHLPIMKHLHCDFCNTLTGTKLVSVKKIRDGKTFNLEIKAEVCPNCKTKYYDGGKLQKFEKYIKEKLSI